MEVAKKARHYVSKQFQHTSQWTLADFLESGEWQKHMKQNKSLVPQKTRCLD
ncbi:hypothetical protein [Bacillus atrophaeus]|uniref:hypothetical protein n=1 Tax=Bacillus atrophaeus TaxID=1452 RepID=UPI002280BC9F|nr:hypothetical protein [Bacillus atrophaeus]